MPKVKIVTETIIYVKSQKDRQAIEGASNWCEKIYDFLCLVRKTLIKDVEFIDQRITSIDIEKDLE